jgi:hypothetical protein
VTYGGDSGNRIFVLYWRCPLIRVSVIRGSSVRILIFLQLLSETFLVLRIILRDIIVNLHRASSKVYVILATFS